MTVRPFRVGEWVTPAVLAGWTYSGLAGRPDAPSSVRRYRRGDWVLEVRARSNSALNARIVAIRTKEEDELWWADERRRRALVVDRRRPRR
jgi:hypothetical protein